MRFFSALLTGTFVAGLIIASPALACSRIASITEADDFQAAKAVFTARVVKTRRVKLISEDVLPPERTFVQAHYKLETGIKGDAPQTGWVTSTTNVGAGCGLPLVAGQDYVFFVQNWPEDTPTELVESSLGHVTIFGSQQLNGNGEEVVERLKAYDGK